MNESLFDPTALKGHRLTEHGHRHIILLSFGANNSGPNFILHLSGEGGRWGAPGGRVS